jgi:hypothetical protein
MARRRRHPRPQPQHARNGNPLATLERQLPDDLFAAARSYQRAFKSARFDRDRIRGAFIPQAEADLDVKRWLETVRGLIVHELGHDAMNLLDAFLINGEALCSESMAGIGRLRVIDMIMKALAIVATIQGPIKSFSRGEECRFMHRM